MNDYASLTTVRVRPQRLLIPPLYEARLVYTIPDKYYPQQRTYYDFCMHHWHSTPSAWTRQGAVRKAKRRYRNMLRKDAAEAGVNGTAVKHR